MQEKIARGDFSAGDGAIQGNPNPSCWRKKISWRESSARNPLRTKVYRSVQNRHLFGVCYSAKYILSRGWRWYRQALPWFRAIAGQGPHWETPARAIWRGRFLPAYTAVGRFAGSVQKPAFIHTQHQQLSSHYPQTDLWPCRSRRSGQKSISWPSLIHRDFELRHYGT